MTRHAASPDAIRRYSMAWLLRAACRVNERGQHQEDEHRRISRNRGVEALFDLSDASMTGEFRKLPAKGV